MRCPFCKKDNDKVIDTRPSEDGAVTRRRRECLECGRRYTTHERLEYSPLKVIKKDNSREPFSREKLLAGVTRALRKRPVTIEAIDAAVDRIEARLLSLGEPEIPSAQIGELVMKELKKLDKVAYIRFASVYRNFADVDEFSEVIREVQTRPRRTRAGRPDPAPDPDPKHELFGR